MKTPKINWDAVNPANAPTWAIIAGAVILVIVIALIAYNLWSLHVKPVKKIMARDGVDKETAKAIYAKEVEKFSKKNEAK